MDAWRFLASPTVSDHSSSDKLQEALKEAEANRQVISRLQAAFRRSEEARHQEQLQSSQLLKEANEKIDALNTELRTSSCRVDQTDGVGHLPPSHAAEEDLFPDFSLRLQAWMQSSEATLVLCFDQQAVPSCIAELTEQCLSHLERCSATIKRLTTELHEQAQALESKAILCLNAASSDLSANSQEVASQALPEDAVDERELPKRSLLGEDQDVGHSPGSFAASSTQTPSSSSFNGTSAEHSTGTEQVSQGVQVDPAYWATGEDLMDGDVLMPRCLDFGQSEVSEIIQVDLELAASTACGAQIPAAKRATNQRQRCPHSSESTHQAEACSCASRKRLGMTALAAHGAKRKRKAFGGTCVKDRDKELQRRMHELLQRSHEREAATAMQFEASRKEAAKTMDTLGEIQEEISKILACPITQQIMQGPFIATDGRTYERLAISHWALQRATCPFTRGALSLDTLQRNHLAEDLLDLWKRFWPQEAAQTPAPEMAPESVSYIFTRVIQARQSSMALECLSRPMLPTSFTLGYSRYGQIMPLLHFVLSYGLEDVAVAVVRRPDYPHTWGYSDQLVMAIHIAAFKGLEKVCRALLALAPGGQKWLTRAGAFILLDDGKKHWLRGRFSSVQLARQQGHAGLATWLARQP